MIRRITPRQIGESWLDYLIEGRTILWWGGLGNSTEHTAYLRLKAGHPGARQRIDRPQRPGRRRADRRPDLHRRLGDAPPRRSRGRRRPGAPRGVRVSHDGVAVHAAQVLAAMEAQAFVDADLDRLFDVGVAQIPRDSIIRRLIDDLRDWRAASPTGARARRWIEERYGYDRYGGNVHVVPNHALMAMSLLYGDGDFGRTLAIVTTAGWDTDCNAGNIGCLMGIRGGLAGIDATRDGTDWRGPGRRPAVPPDRRRRPRDLRRGARRRCARRHGATHARAARPSHPKGGARFHFERPGSVQGFQPDAGRRVRHRDQRPGPLGDRARVASAIAQAHLAAGERAASRRPTFAPLVDTVDADRTTSWRPDAVPGPDGHCARRGGRRRTRHPIEVGLVVHHATGDGRVAPRRVPGAAQSGRGRRSSMARPGCRRAADRRRRHRVRPAPAAGRPRRRWRPTWTAWAGSGPPEVRCGRPPDGGEDVAAGMDRCCRSRRCREPRSPIG